MKKYEIPEYQVKMVADRHVPFERRPKVITSSAAADIFRQMIPEDELHFREHMVMLMTNASAKVIGQYRISIGGLNSAILDVRVVAQAALNCLATGVFICHNHPTGNKTASEADKKITKRLQQALKILDIDLIDHIILAGDDYLSFRDEGLI